MYFHPWTPVFPRKKGKGPTKRLPPKFFIRSNRTAGTRPGIIDRELRSPSGTGGRFLLTWNYILYMIHTSRKCSLIQFPENTNARCGVSNGGR